MSLRKVTEKGCLTIKQLKDIVKDLVEVNEYGEPYEVWITDVDGHTSPVYEVDRFNISNDGHDILFDVP